MSVSEERSKPANFWNDLAERLLQGHQLTRSEGLAVLEAGEDELLSLLGAAFRLRLQAFGRIVQLYVLKNAKSGLCPEDCGYCSQSACSTAEIEKYRLRDDDELMEGAREAAESHARTYCIVGSGRGPTETDVTNICRVVGKIKQTYPLRICCSLGLLTPDQAAQLKAAGVNRINHNLNTSRRFYDHICTTHTFDDRLETLSIAREAGLELCCGVIVGMGEESEDIVDVALQLRELDVDSIPVNFLNPISGTPLQDMQQLDPRFCLRVLCLLRFANPTTEIRIAGGREVNLRSLQPMGLYPANSIFVSDYLTTKGQAAEDDFQMIRDLGFEIIEEGHKGP
jgi:biotin synthase